MATFAAGPAVASSSSCRWRSGCSYNGSSGKEFLKEVVKCTAARAAPVRNDKILQNSISCYEWCVKDAAAMIGSSCKGGK